MGEYGGAINNGPAGQVGGGAQIGGGAPASGQAPDVLGTISHTFNDVVNQVLALPTEVLAVGIVVFFLGIIVLKRAF